MGLLIVITTGYSQSNQEPVTIKEIKQTITKGKETVIFYKERIKILDEMTAKLRANYAIQAKIKKPSPDTTRALNLDLIAIAKERKKTLTAQLVTIEGIEALETLLQRQQKRNLHATELEYPGEKKLQDIRLTINYLNEENRNLYENR